MGMEGTITKAGKRAAPLRVEGSRWNEVRDAFVKRELRPTNGELAAEFAVPESTLSRIAVDQGWPMLRAKEIEARLEAAGAGEVLLQALKSSRAIVTAGEGFALLYLQRLTELLGTIDMTRALATNASTLNTLSFAFGNVAKGAKDLGIVGFAKSLNDEGKMGNGQWDPKLLQQINITVKNLTGKAAENAVTVETTNASDVL